MPVRNLSTLKTLRRIPRSHLVVYTRIERPGYASCAIHALYVMQDQEPRLFVRFVRYVLDTGRKRSIRWQQNAARAVGWYIDFMEAHHDVWTDDEGPQSLSAFAEAMVAGTIDENGRDPSGLYWPPLSVSRAAYLFSLVTAFGDYVASKTGRPQLNPWRKATVAERILAARRGLRQSQHSAFRRNGGRKRDWTVRSVGVQRRAASSERLIKAFPKARLCELLECFVRRGKRRASGLDGIDVRDVMITLLLHGGGLRVSEAFHLYVSDVEPDPANPRSALVRLYHPEQGEAPLDSTLTTVAHDREDYLKRRWRRVPRTQEKGRFHVGWKHLYLTDASRRCAEVHWHPPVLGEVFLRLYNFYYRHVRPKDCPHPFLFASERKTERGEPYTVDAYAQKHANAVGRMGLTVGKRHGTTLHAHRHDFAQSIAHAGVERPVIQRALHHRSPFSQDVYTGGTTATPDPWSTVDGQSAQAFFSRLMKDPFEGGQP